MSDHELLPLYALGALPPDERTSFDTHLADCAQCRAELATYGPTMDVLSSAVAATPPPQLRDRVLSEIARAPGESDADDGPAHAGPAGAVSGAHGAGVPGSGVRGTGAARDGEAAAPQARSPRSTPAAARRPFANQTFALAAGILLFAIVSVAAVGLWRRADALDARVVELSEQVAQLDDVAAVLAAADARVLDRTSELTGGVNLVVANSADRVVIFGDDLQAPPDGRVYQVWLVEDAQPAGAGLLTRRDGVLAIVSELGSADAVALTIEPPGGSPAPTGATVVRAPLN